MSFDVAGTVLKAPSPCERTISEYVWPAGTSGLHHDEPDDGRRRVQRRDLLNCCVVQEGTAPTVHANEG